jgi:hypothetical protein
MTLTDRYVDAALRRLPSRQRPDIERELRASIADAVDDRVEGGTDATAAELAVLTELGDPQRLAAGYADRPLHLIGPALFLDYTRLLATLLATVLPAVAAIVALVRAMDDADAGTVVADAFSATFTAAIHIGFWTTVLFAVIERFPGQHWQIRTWTPDALPEPPSRRAKYTELILETAATVLFSTLILLTPVVSTEKDASGDPIGLLSPWLWDTGVVYGFLALVVVALGFSFARYYGRWNMPIAIASGLTTIACSILLIALAANDRILNPEFIAAAGWSDDANRWVYIGIVATSIGTLAHAVVEAAKQVRKG